MHNPWHTSGPTQSANTGRCVRFEGLERFLAERRSCEIITTSHKIRKIRVTRASKGEYLSSLPLDDMIAGQARHNLSRGRGQSTIVCMI